MNLKKTLSLANALEESLSVALVTEIYGKEAKNPLMYPAGLLLEDLINQVRKVRDTLNRANTEE